MRKALARDIRTGDVISTPWAPDRTLTVDFPTWEKFTSPQEGWTRDVIRFTGTDNFGKRVEKGWGQFPDGRVYVVDEAPHDGNTFGELP